MLVSLGRNCQGTLHQAFVLKAIVVLDSCQCLSICVTV